MFRTLLFAVCAVRAEYWHNDNSPKNSPKGWLENLKRRLMLDNYDYQESGSEMQMRAVDENPLDTPLDALTEAPIDAPMETKAPQIQFVYDIPDKQINDSGNAFDVPTENSLYVPHQRADDDFFTSPVPEYPVQMSYDEEGISRNDVQILIVNQNEKATNGPGAVRVAPKNVSYKIIKPSLLSRRAGGIAPRFVEEVGADGVALLSVDGAPFPQFQLPAARRQYQVARDSESDWVY